MLPPTIPLFPLPNVVLFPGVYLPLHIFEPRYREMVQDALHDDRIIGMTLLRPGYEAEYEGRPPIYAVGCAGVITHVERLPDGRFNLILRGLEKFRVLDEEAAAAGGPLYRRATVAAMDEAVAELERPPLRETRQRLEALLAPLIDTATRSMHITEAMADEDLVNALAQYLDFDPLEKQALLERHGVLARGRSMIELVEMKALQDRAPRQGGTVH